MYSFCVYGCVVKSLECHEGLVCVICIRWVVRGDGLFAPFFTSLSAMPLPRVPRCVRIFWMVIG